MSYLSQLSDGLDPMPAATAPTPISRLSTGRIAMRPPQPQQCPALPDATASSMSTQRTQPSRPAADARASGTTFATSQSESLQPHEPVGAPPQGASLHQSAAPVQAGVPMVAAGPWPPAPALPSYGAQFADRLPASWAAGMATQSSRQQAGPSGDAVAMVDLPEHISSAFSALSRQHDALRAYAAALDAGTAELEKTTHNVRRRAPVAKTTAGGDVGKQKPGTLQRNSTLRAEAANDEEAELLTAVAFANSLQVTPLPALPTASGQEMLVEKTTSPDSHVVEQSPYDKDDANQEADPSLIEASLREVAELMAKLTREREALIARVDLTGVSEDEDDDDGTTK